VIVYVDESLTFYKDSTKTHATDVALDAAPRRQAPAPTQPEPFNLDPSDKVAELSAITRTDADGIISYMLSSLLPILVFTLELQLYKLLKT